MAKYNGHRNWNSWNVSLWLLNRERTYKKIKLLLCYYTKDEVAEILLREYKGCITNDGAKYHKTSIRDALKHL